MSFRRFDELDSILRAAFEVPEQERSAHLERVCGEDGELLVAARRLLAHCEGENPDDPLSSLAGAIERTLTRSVEPSSLTGQQLRQYEVLERLGAGGMGEVYRARDPRLGRDVAIKVILANEFASEEARSRFEREARAVAALSHPNIVTIHELGRERGIDYSVMELLAGRTLAEEIASSGPFSVERAARIGADVAHGLAAAHETGIAHRDIKPANLFLRDDGRVTILDFGLAASVVPTLENLADEETLPGSRTAPGVVLGTLSYMSPEQARGEPATQSSDIFALGCVLYEMVTGRPPFRRNSPGETIAAVLGDQPEPLTASVSGSRALKLSSVVDRCLAKSPEDRYASASELEGDLRNLGQHSRLLPRSLVGRLSAALAVLLLLAAASWIATRDPEARWAREEALPRLFELAKEEKYFEAWQLARQIEEVLPGDPLLQQAWQGFAQPRSINSEPEGAVVSISSLQEEQWTELGSTPLESVQLPAGTFRFRMEKEGFQSIEGLGVAANSMRLSKVGSIDEGMIRVAGGYWRLNLRAIPPTLNGTLPDYYLGRYEVTNEEFAAFVEAQGYQDPSYWTTPIGDGDGTLTFEQAMAVLLDSTGNAGPSTWEHGRYPPGEESFPVRGISWYEADAYARFARAQLPTIFHWGKAAGTHASGAIAAVSNLDSDSVLPVGSLAGMGYFGNYDTAGNVREWSRTRSPDGRRYILGGGFSEPRTAFHLAVAIGPLDRSELNGVRIMRPTPDQLVDPALEQAVPNVDLTKTGLDLPGPGPEFADQWQERVAYVQDDLEAEMEPLPESLVGWSPTGEDPEDYRVERAVFNAAYGGERMAAYLYLPRGQAEPLQPVLWFPGDAMTATTYRGANPVSHFVVQSGRALVIPVYKSTFERRDGLVGASPDPRRGENLQQDWEDHAVMWVQDVMRTLDYLETRSDLDLEKVGYVGHSWGAWMSTYVLPVEPRIRAAVLIDGGVPSAYAHALVPNTLLGRYPNSHQPLLARVEIPVLMLNARSDHWFPVDTTQFPYFESLGTPLDHKHYRIFEDAGRADGNRPAVIRVSLPFLDQYLGEVGS